MDINKWIKWGEIWNKEICLESSIDSLDDSESKDNEVINLIKQFKRDKDVELMPDECHLTDGELIFCFGESGGQNPSDTEGWSRGYIFVVDSDYLIIDCQYEQG